MSRTGSRVVVSKIGSRACKSRCSAGRLIHGALKNGLCIAAQAICRLAVKNWVQLTSIQLDGQY